MIKGYGAPHELTPMNLLKPLYQALEWRNGLNPSNIDDVLPGCIRQYHEPGLTVARSCGSSLGAACLAMQPDLPTWILGFSANNSTRWMPIGPRADLIATQQGLGSSLSLIWVFRQIR